MKIKLLHDFGGVETNEQHFKKDEVVDVSSQVANDLVLLGHAVKLDQPAPARVPVEVEEVEVESDEEAEPVKRRGRKG